VTVHRDRWSEETLCERYRNVWNGSDPLYDPDLYLGLAD